MTRYDLITSYRCGSCIEEMEPSEDGEWVRWEDVQTENALLKRALAMLARDSEFAPPRLRLADETDQ